MQNAEQSDDTLWGRLQQRPDLKPRDQLYVEYSADEFKGLEVDKETELELYEFVEDIKRHGPRFYGYSEDKIAHFAKRIYELRKDNADNAT